MDEAIDKSFSLALDLIVAAALVAMTGFLLKMAYSSYNGALKDTALANEYRSRAEFGKYSEEMLADEIIYFIVTYGDTYRYAYREKGSINIKCSENMSLDTVATIKQATGMDDSYTFNIGSFPIISVELQDIFKNALINTVDGTNDVGSAYEYIVSATSKFKITPITKEGVKLSLSDAGNAFIILIEEL